VPLAVAVESLLAPETAPEISYRLRVRGAALARLTSTLDPTDAAARIRRLYETRSAVVHGEEVDSSRFNTAKEDGTAVLRMILLGVERRPELLDARLLDSALITGEPSPP